MRKLAFADAAACEMLPPPPRSFLHEMQRKVKPAEINAEREFFVSARDVMISRPLRRDYASIFLSPRFRVAKWSIWAQIALLGTLTNT